MVIEDDETDKVGVVVGADDVRTGLVERRVGNCDKV